MGFDFAVGAYAATTVGWVKRSVPIMLSVMGTKNPFAHPTKIDLSRLFFASVQKKSILGVGHLWI